MVLISKDEVERQIRQLQRAIHFCIHAQPSRSVPLDAPNTDTYPGASGNACQAMKDAVCTLESHMQLS